MRQSRSQRALGNNITYACEGGMNEGGKCSSKLVLLLVREGRMMRVETSPISVEPQSNDGNK